jgi:hypothetical protein
MILSFNSRDFVKEIKLNRQRATERKKEDGIVYVFVVVVVVVVLIRYLSQF